MNDDILGYYESELRFIREMGAEFARTYPAVAERLLLEDTACNDPHVERLIEAFALIAGRIRHKIDDEFPEITESLLGLLYPHYLRPIPSMAIAQFAFDPTQVTTAPHRIPRNSEVLTRPLSDLGTPCRFRTCYATTVWPLQVVSASLLTPGVFPAGVSAGRAVAGIRIELRSQGGIPLAGIGLDRLRFFLDGDDSVVHTLYELILNNASRLALMGRPTGKRPVHVPFPPNSIQPVGFEHDDGLFPYPQRSFVGYRLLQEYFSFPSKFLFFDICGFEQLLLTFFGDSCEIYIFLSEFERRERIGLLEQGVKSDTFRLGCTPIVNLFQKIAEPIRLTHAQTEYHIVPDLHLPTATEVYSVDRVTSSNGARRQVKEYEPFYALRHVYDTEPTRAYWHTSRRASLRKDDEGAEVYISLVDLDFEPTKPADEALTIYVTCTNRDLPPKLPLSQQFGELWMEFSPMLRARCLHRPTKPLRPPLREKLQWRLISHLALNHLSLGEGSERGSASADALREILRLYNYSNAPAVRKHIDGILSVSSKPHLAPITSSEGVVFALGVRVDLEFDEMQYAGSGVFLLASVLERFLGLYSALNSFSQLTVRTTQRKEVLRRWNPRVGEQILL